FDRAVESIAARAVVLRNGGAAVLADIATVVGGEDKRLRHWDGTFADLLAVDIERHLAALAETPTGIGKLHAYLVLARRQRPCSFNVVVIHAGDVVAVFERAVLRVEAPAADIGTLGDDHTLGTHIRHHDLRGHRVGFVLDALFLMLRTQFSDRRPMPPNSSWVFPLISTGRPAVSGLNFSAVRSSIGNTL